MRWFWPISVGLVCVLIVAAWLSGSGVTALDGRILIALRRSLPADAGAAAALNDMMLSMTALGALPTLVLVLIIAVGMLLAAGRRRVAVGLLWRGAGGIAVANVAKDLIDRTRPAVVPHWAHVSSSSFPSGHSADSAIVYFLIAATVTDLIGDGRPARYAQACAVILVVLVGLSRLYLGVHWPTDVLAGWATGSGWVWLCRRGWLSGRVVRSVPSARP